MADIIEGVHPTRMELLEINKRIKLADKGHKLLKEKRDSLIAEFFGVIDKAKDSRTELAGIMERAYNDLIRAEALMGTASVEGIAVATPEKGSIEMSSKNIMGVGIPEIEFLEDKSGLDEGLYGLAFTSSKLDDASQKFDLALKKTIKLIGIEEIIRRLGEEIKKTKRRVNALEYIMIPKLSNTQRYITMRLEEMERESFFRLKMVKKKREREAG